MFDGKQKNSWNHFAPHLVWKIDIPNAHLLITVGTTRIEFRKFFYRFYSSTLQHLSHVTTQRCPTMPQVFQIFCKNKSSTSKCNVPWHTQSSLIISKFTGKFRKSCNSWRIRKSGKTVLSQPSCVFSRARLGRGMKKWNIYCRDMPRTRLINHYQWVFWLSWLKYAVSIYTHTRNFDTSVWWFKVYLAK